MTITAPSKTGPSSPVPSTTAPTHTDPINADPLSTNETSTSAPSANDAANESNTSHARRRVVIDEDYAAIPYLRQGQQINLIRWCHAEDRWTYETLHGNYCGRDRARWLLEINGTVTSIDRDEWAFFT